MTIVLVVVAGVVVGVLIEVALTRRTARRAPVIEPIEGTLLPPPAPPRRRAGDRPAATSRLVVGEDGSIGFVDPGEPATSDVDDHGDGGPHPTGDGSGAH